MENDSVEKMRVEVQAMLEESGGRFPVKQVDRKLARSILSFQDQVGLSTTEMAGRLGLRRGQLQHLRKEYGRVSGRRVGPQVRFRPVEVEAYEKALPTRESPIELHLGGELWLRVPTVPMVLEILRVLRSGF